MNNIKTAISTFLVLVMCLSVVAFAPAEVKAAGETFIIDPGHGGSDPGACDYGRSEAWDVLNLSMRVGELMSSVTSVTYTRTTDTFVSLQGRCDIANGNGNKYFCSIHRNAGGGTGVETYYYSGSTSAAMASEVNGRLAAAAPWRNRGVKTASYVVIRNTSMPAILAEVGFIDSSHDNSCFDQYFDDIAYAIAGGLLAMIGAEPSAPVNRQLEGHDPIDLGSNFYAHVKQTATGLYLTDKDFNACVSEGVFDVSQTWHFTRHSNGAYTLGIDSTGVNIDVAGGNFSDGANVQMYPWNNSKAQMFFIYYINGNFYFKSLGDRTLDIDASTNNVQLYGCDTGIGEREENPIKFNARSFEIYKLNIDGSEWNAYFAPSFTGYIRNVHTGRLMTADGDNVVFTDPAFTENQKWTITRNQYGGHEIKAANGKVLDVTGASLDHGTDINLYEANGSKAQAFFFINTGGSRFYIKPSYSSMVVDMDAGNFEPHTCLYGTGEGNIQAQVFEIVSDLHIGEDGGRRGARYFGEKLTANIRLNIDGKAITSEGGSALMRDFNGGENQVWTLTYNKEWNAYSVIASDGKALDVAAAGFNDRTMIQTYEANGSAAQLFRFYPAGTGYMISPANTQKVLDIATEDNTTIQLYGSAPLDSRLFSVNVITIDDKKPVYLGESFEASIQNTASGLYLTGKAEGVLNCTNKESTWKFVLQEDGSYVIQNKELGKVLDIDNAAVEDGTNVQLWDANGSLAQKFFIYESQGGYALYYAKAPMVIDMDATTKEVHVYPKGTNYAAQVFTLNIDESTVVDPNAPVEPPVSDDETLILKDDSSLTKAETYLKKVSASSTAKEILSQFENKNIAVFDKDGNQVSDNSVCGTGYSVNLVVNGEVIDALVIVVAGDVDGNGIVDSTDYMRVKNKFLGTYSLEGAFFAAGDVYEDDVIDSTDYMRIKQIFIGR